MIQKLGIIIECALRYIELPGLPEKDWELEHSALNINLMSIGLDPNRMPDTCRDRSIFLLKLAMGRTP